MTKSNHPIYILLLDSLKGQKKNILILFFIILIFNLIELSFPKLFQMLIDLLKNKETSIFNYEISISTVNLEGLYFIPLCLFVLAILKWIISYIRIYVQSLISQTAIYRLRTKIFKKIHLLNFKFHDNFHSGNLISNIVEDIRYLNQFLEMGLFTLVESVFYITMSYIFLVLISWPVAICCLSIQFTSTVVSLLLLKRSYPRLIKTKVLFSSMVEDFTENMEGNLVTNSLGIKQYKIDQNKEKVNDLHDSTQKEIIYISIYHQINIWSGYFNIFIGVTFAVYLYQQNDLLTIGTIFLIFYLLNSIIPRIRVYSRAVDLLLRTMVTAQRVQTILSSESIIEDSGKLEVEDNQIIKFNNVSFEFVKGKKVLNNIHIELPQNQLIGLVGYTGSGKTTFLQILAKFYKPISGTITINNKDISQYSIKSVREKISLVFQETFLFSTTIQENISFGKPNAAIDEIQKVAKIACIHEFISTLPNGYQTLVGEKGVSLSGGQKQRIGIARALLQNPQILLMDDCTSALDAETEVNIINNISKNRKDTTTLFTSQRLNSLVNCQYLYVMEKGEIVEEGSFETLNRKDSHFMKIFSPIADEDGKEIK